MFFLGSTLVSTYYSFCWSRISTSAMYSFIVPTFSSSVPLYPSVSTWASTYYVFCLSGTESAFTNSSIVLTFAESVSIFILDYLNLFSGKKLAPTSSPNSPTGLYYFCNTYATTNVSVWTPGIPDA